LAAYPVLVPIYVAQYEASSFDPQDAVTFTAVLEAHSKEGAL